MTDYKLIHYNIFKWIPRLYLVSFRFNMTHPGTIKVVCSLIKEKGSSY